MLMRTNGIFLQSTRYVNVLFFAEAAAAPASPRILIENADSVALLGRLNEEIFTLFLGSLAILSRNQDYPWLKTEVGLGWLVFS